MICRVSKHLGLFGVPSQHTCHVWFQAPSYFQARAAFWHEAYETSGASRFSDEEVNGALQVRLGWGCKWAGSGVFGH